MKPANSIENDFWGIDNSAQDFLVLHNPETGGACFYPTSQWSGWARMLLNPTIWYGDADPSSPRVNTYMEIVYRHTSYVIAEIIRTRWDKKFKPVKIKRNIKAGVRKYAALWESVINLISELYLINSQNFRHPGEWFFCLYAEQKLAPLLSTESTNKTGFLKLARQENQQLLARQNPFDDNEYPQTFRFVRRAITLANRDTTISPLYNEFVFSRRSLVAWLAENAQVMVLDEKGNYSQKLQGGHQRAKFF